MGCHLKKNGQVAFNVPHGKPRDNEFEMSEQDK